MKYKAYTLVELLVVIVIIGILATISVATFSGYFEQARNAKRIAVLDMYIDALNQYRIFNNEQMPTPIRPRPDGSVDQRQICLGDYDDDACLIGGTGTTENQIFNQEIQPYLNSSATDLGVFNNSEGAIISYEPLSAGRVIDGQTKAMFLILYFLEGNMADCGHKALAIDGSGGYLTNNPNNYTVNSADRPRTFCVHLYDSL